MLLLSLVDAVGVVDFGAGFGFGKNIAIKKMNLFTVNNVGYSTNYQFAQMKRYRYQNDQIDYPLRTFDVTMKGHFREASPGFNPA